MGLAPDVYQAVAPQSAITVVRRTRALGRHHGRSQRMVGCAAFAIRRTFFRLLCSLHYQTANTLGILLCGVSRNAKTGLGIKLGKLRSQSQPALCDLADPAPLPMHDAKDPC